MYFCGVDFCGKLTHELNFPVFMLSFQMNAAWEALNRTWRERMERLEEAMTASVQYQDALQVRSCLFLLVYGEVGLYFV